MDTLAAIAAAASTERLSGVDLNYAWSSPEISDKDVQLALETHNLRARCITPVIYGRRFIRGSFSNPDPALRAEAAAIAHESVEVTARLGADYVKFWPGQDGYDYPFHAIGAVRDSLDTIDLLRERARRVSVADLDAARAGHDALAAQRLVRQALFG